MAGIIFLAVAFVAFVGLVIYIKKTDSRVNKELMKELYDKGSSNKEDIAEMQQEESLNLRSENTEDENEDNIETLESVNPLEYLEEPIEEYEKYSYDSYKSDEEYLRVARLMKNIYYGIVCIVILLLGILYIVLFKI